MANAALLAIGPGHLMHLVPLLFAVSLVYSATRHEKTDEIRAGFYRAVVTFGGFLVAIFAVLAVLSWVI
jgi:uncharacterized membrane protein YjfL (UPF0719 family)